MTTWLLAAVLAAVALAPLAFSLLRPARARGRREADLALYRAQIAELDRERDAGRLDGAAHRAAMLEVQRRLLAAPEEQAATAATGPGRALLPALMLLLPALAFGLYAWRGAPGLPSATQAERTATRTQEEALLAQLRTRLAELDPRSEAARQGFMLLGNAERSRGRPEAAVEAWRRALESRFDPGLASEIAELEIERGAHDAALALLARAQQSGELTEGLRLRLRFLTGLAEEAAGRPDAARAAWQRIIDESPPEAPWRAMVQRRMDRLP
jgi:cytochrome c-type biogenesis protein CcmH